MAEPLVVAQGRKHKLELYENRLVITKTKGLLARFSGSRTMFLDQITDINFKEAGILPGSISFEKGDNSGFWRGLEMSKNNFTFNSDHNNEFLQLKKKIEELV